MALLMQKVSHSWGNVKPVYILWKLNNAKNISNIKICIIGMQNGFYI